MEKIEAGYKLFEKYVGNFGKKVIITALAVWMTIWVFAWTLGVSELRTATIRIIERVSTSEEFQHYILNKIINNEVSDGVNMEIQNIKKDVAIWKEATKKNAAQIKSNTSRIWILEQKNNK